MTKASANTAIRLFLFLLRLARANERHIAAPASLSVFVLMLAAQFVKVLAAENDGLVAYGLQELLAFLNSVECGQLIDGAGCHFHVVLFQEGGQGFFTHLLHFATLTAQDGLYLGLGLSS